MQETERPQHVRLNAANLYWHMKYTNADKMLPVAEAVKTQVARIKRRHKMPKAKLPRIAKADAIAPGLSVHAVLHWVHSVKQGQGENLKVLANLHHLAVARFG